MGATALVIVDVQVDFCEGGALAVAGGTRVAADTTRFLATHSFDHVVATRDCHIDPGAHFSDAPDYVDSWPRHCVAGTSGAEMHTALAVDRIEAVFDKGHYSAAYSGFEGTDGSATLEAWLVERDVDQVTIVGIALDHCVRATALDSARHGFATTVIARLTASVDPTSTPGIVAELTSVGVHVR